MSEPIFGGRQAQPLDQMLDAAGGAGWDGLSDLMKPHLADRPLQPSDQVARHLALLAKDPRAREIIEWLMDITLRAPFRPIGATLQETALHAAKRQGINGVGEAVLAAIAHGQTLMEKK
ncbi:MAG: hypothetical protein CML67_02135 [Rhodobacteraceae bacterium]|nr:hypothetical protein [Paracoccaceae bacterium]